MKNPSIPEPIIYRPPPIQDVNGLIEPRYAAGALTIDWVVTVIGSWPFIIGQSAMLTLWVILNVIALIQHLDPYPFILTNLNLPAQTACTSHVNIMSQNWPSEIDRFEAHIGASHVWLELFPAGDRHDCPGHHRSGIVDWND